MPKCKKINKRIHRNNDGIRGTIRQQNTSSGSTHRQNPNYTQSEQGQKKAIANFIKEATTTKANIRIHTDSTSGKSIATRIGSSKKAKHIDLKYLFIQQLVQSGILSIHKISTHDNSADILTKYVPAEVLDKHLYMAGVRCPEHDHLAAADQKFDTTSKHRPACTIRTRLREPWYSISSRIWIPSPI